jgi:hypothetical protein
MRGESGEQAAGRRRMRRAWKNKIIEGVHKLGAYVPRPAEEHKDRPYDPQLHDLAEDHKSLCSSEI